MLAEGRIICRPLYFRYSNKAVRNHYPLCLVLARAASTRHRGIY